jgi:1,4-alpha-glucan branching enzyme
MEDDKNRPATVRATPSSSLVHAGRVPSLLAGEHPSPHDILGAHPWRIGGVQGIVVRALHPDACGVDLLPAGEAGVPLEPIGGGLFAAFLPGRSLPMRYRLRFRFRDEATWERGDPYRYLPTVGEMDLYLHGEGTHRRPWEFLGAHVRTIEGETGVSFAVWAPTARRVSVVGDFCAWDGRLLPMRALGSAGLWELFVPGVEPGALYKFEIVTREGELRVKTDPVARAMERPPGTASRVVAGSSHAWCDGEWMAGRQSREWAREPMLIYEVHLGSWRRVPEEGGRPLGYREIAPLLAEHVLSLGFTHVQLLPVMEHPFEGSWGYQVTGYYAPTARFGTPDDFRFFVDTLHRAGIGVLLDWVPGHFPRDDFALRRFDGTALYEHEDPRLGEHQDWGTLIFNYGRREVESFLLGSALYWLDQFHVDGLRVDAVASMLYLDYSRKAGEWLPNRWGGKENVEAIEFLRHLNEVVREDYPGCVVVAEESTSWSGVTRPTFVGGLGFTFKWNMGWMHDTLGYFSRDPLYRGYHHDEITFAMLYQYSESFIDPISHDEVVHGKRSLVEKLPGDAWQKLANLRLLLTYQITRPGKSLLFMGFELASPTEWNHAASLDWHLESDPTRQELRRFVARLGRLYRESPCLWRSDPDPEGFAWIDCHDRDNAVVSYARWDTRPEGRAASHVIVVVNMKPEPHHGYRLGVPEAGAYQEILSSDDRDFGGSEVETLATLDTEPVPYHGHPQSVRLVVPPLGALVLAPLGARRA